MEKVGKLRFNRGDLITANGRYGSVFRGTFRNVVPVAIKHLEKRNARIDCDLYVKAIGHPNVINYFCINNKDVEFRYTVHIKT